MPHKKGERLYRSFSASNFKPVERSLPELREDAEQVEQVYEPTYKVRGYYTVFGAEYELYPAMPSLDWPAEYEQIDAHALDGADLSDVIFQENHRDSPLARIKNGSLTLGTDDHGAWCEADLGGCRRGRELYESIVNGLITEMSFGFVIADDEDGKGMVTTRDEHGDYHTTITRISKVFDVSGVSIPASPFTEISELRCRSAASDVIDADRERVEQERAEAERVEREEQERIEREAHAASLRKRRARALALQSIGC